MTCASTFFSLAPEQITPRDEARFFGRLKTANDTFKKTEPARLAAIDAALVATLARERSAITTALDLGISSGVTTIELVDALSGAGHDAVMTGTDRSVRARIVDLPHGCRALVEPNGHVLQYEVLGQAVRPWERRLDRYTGMNALRRLIEIQLRREAVDRARSGEGVEVALVSPRLQLSRGFRLLEDDVTRRNDLFVGRFDLVRAANLFNRHYFEPEVLRRAIGNAISYLMPGGWLLVVRTHGAADHRGTLFRKGSDGGIDVVERYGPGSEVEDVVLESGVVALP